MKKIILLGLVFFGLAKISQGQTIVWTGTTSADFFDASNWVGGLGYTGGEDILFDGNGGSNNCNVTANDMSAASFSVMSGYTGIIDFGAQDHFIDNAFVVNSGTVIGTSSSLSMLGSGRFEKGALGTYSTNGGAFGIQMSPGQAFNFVGNLVLDAVDVTTSSNGSQRNVDFGTNLTVEDLNIISNTGSNRPISFQGTVHIKNSLVLNGTSTTALTGNTANFIFDGTNATISGSSAFDRMPLPNITINTSGNLSMTGNVNCTGNWTGTQGTLTAGTSTVNMSGVSTSISGSAAAFDNLIIRSGASVTLPASEVLIGGTLTRTGTLTFQSGTILGLNGTGAQSISGSAITLGGIHAYPGSRTITMSTGVTILDFLQVDAGVTFASGGNITLAASSSQTARVAELGAGASVGGNVTVETFLPGGSTGWANLGVRGVTGQSVANWDTHVSSGGANGVPMTCTLCSFNPTVLSTPFTSIQGWDEPTDSYVELIATDPMNPGVGRWVYVGDGPTTTGDLKLVNTGPLVQGLVSVPVSASGAGNGLGAFYNLVANPYACPISASSLLFGLNTNNQFDFSYVIYVWNANLGGGSGAYTAYTNGFSDGQGQTDVIPGGQAFYVEYSPFLATAIEFEENMKISTNAPVLKSASVGQLMRLTLSGANEENTTGFRIHPEATPFYDRKFDAHKLFTTPGYVGFPGPYSNYTTLSSKDAFGVDYAIQSLPPLTNSVSIPILAKVSTSGTYTISVTERVDFNSCLVLIDRLDNSYHDLGVAPYVFTISDTTSAPRFDLVLCKDESYTPAGINENVSSSNILINQDQQGAYVKTVFPKNTKATISVYNLVGQKLIDDMEVEGTTTNTRINLDVHNQVVFIRVLTDKENSVKKMVIH